MRRILVTEDGWLVCRAELNKRGIELEVRPRAVYEKGIDGLLVPVTAWPVAPSRKHYAPIVVYGRSDEVGDLRNDPALTVLETDGLVSTELAAEAVDLAFTATRLPFLRRPSVAAKPSLAPKTSTIRDAVEAWFSEAGLSERQRETARFASEGLSREETAARMGVAEPTVRAQRSLIFSKLRVKNANELQARAAKLRGK